MEKTLADILAEMVDRKHLDVFHESFRQSGKKEALAILDLPISIEKFARVQDFFNSIKSTCTTATGPSLQTENIELKQQMNKLFKLGETVITSDYHPPLYQRSQLIFSASNEEKQEMRTFAISLLYKWFMLQQNNPDFSLQSDYYECLATRWFCIEAYDPCNLDLVFGPDPKALEKISEQRVKAGMWSNISGHLVIPWQAKEFLQKVTNPVLMGHEQFETLQMELCKLIRELKH